MIEENFGMLTQEAGDGSGSNQGTAITVDHSVHLPAYISYLSLGFKILSTMIVVFMATWVIITIKTTRSLHKTHNIYVAYLMAIDVMVSFTNMLLSGAMTIGYYTGVGDIFGCNVFIFMLYPTVLIFLTFLAMSVDKAIAITFPFKHRELMKPRVVRGILVAKYLSVVMIYARNLFASSSFTKVAQFGTCIIRDPAVLEAFITVTIPVFFTSKDCVVGHRGNKSTSIQTMRANSSL